jgi:hypothetical protein
MNPLLMAGLSALPGVVNAVGNVARGIGNVQGATYGLTPAQDPMKLGQGMTAGAIGTFGPGGELSNAAQMQANAQSARNYNMQNKGFNEALKRSYAADSYKNALAIGSGAIDNYLQRAANQDQLMTQALGMRY